MKKVEGQITKSTYSGVPVYEFMCKGVSVMRRMEDAWVNATHILKVGGYDKPQRTKILERDIQKGIHEKVQGGYGKYQGTWVPLDKARGVAAQYDVGTLLDPLFDYVPRENSPPPLPKGSKPKPAARSASDMDGGGGSNAPTPKRARKVSTMPAKAAEDGPKKRRGRPPGATKAAAAAETISKKSLPPPRKLPDDRMLPPRAADHDDNASVDSAPATIPDDEAGSLSGPDSASVSSRSSSPSDFMSGSDIDAALSNGYHHNGGGQRESAVNDDYHNNNVAASMQRSQFMDSDMIAADYSSRLLDYFMAPDDNNIPEFISHPPPGFKINQVIDDEGHTAFHWSCAMGILKIIEVLIDIGADIHAVNLAGQTPLIRSIMFTNNYDRRTFPRVVELLRDTIFHVDANRQTILHHIANTTSSRSKLSSTRYYTEIILAKVSETQPMHALTSFLDRKDNNGDTALLIAARNGARKCVKVLLSYNASANIPNKQGQTAYEFIYPDDALRPYLQKDHLHDSYKSKSNSSPAQPNGHHHHHHVASTPDNQSNDHHYTNGGGHGSSLLRSGNFGMVGGNGNVLGNPHVAEAAIKASQQTSSAMAGYLEDLANAYDNELKEKEADVEQVQQLLNDMKNEITNADQSVHQIETRLGDESSVESCMEESRRLVDVRTTQLKKLVERTQSRDLAQMVQQEEQNIKAEALQSSASHYNMEECVELAQELTNLQTQRQKLVEEITELCANAGVGEKMNDYRQLVATSCGVKFEEIDDLLDGIAQALTENNEDEQDHAAGDTAAKLVNGDANPIPI
jgi:transcription factor MBP1